VQDEERKAFSSQFNNFEFAGSTEHWAAIPLMRKAKATLHIVPDFAKERGLMTARVFTSQMADCLCFCDSLIHGAEYFFPDDLIVDDGDNIKRRWASVQFRKEKILEEREWLLKNHSVEQRAKDFVKLLNEYGISGEASKREQKYIA
jgi:hypothetical protein